MNNYLKKDSAYISKDLWGSLFKVYRADVMTLKLLTVIVSKINLENPDPEQLHDLQIPLAEIYESLDLSGANRLQVVKRCINNILKNIIDIETENAWYPVVFLDVKETFIDKRNQKLHTSITDGFFPFLANLKRFLKIRVSTARLSNRCFLFYCALTQIHKDRIYKLPLAALQSACNVRYVSYGTFKQQFLLPVIEDLKKIGINVSFDEIKVASRVDALSFQIVETKMIEQVQESQVELLTEKAKHCMTPDNIRAVYKHYLQTFGMLESEYQLTPARERLICTRLKDFTPEQLKQAISNVKKDPWEERPNFSDLTKHILKTIEETEKWVHYKPNKTNTDSAPKVDYKGDSRYQPEYDRLLRLGYDPVYAHSKTLGFLRTGVQFEPVAAATNDIYTNLGV